jgi:hypothetical protein
MPAAARRLSVLRDAIGVILRTLAALPPSAEVEELKATAEGCLNDVEGWSRSPPRPEERDHMSKRVLKLHVEVAKWDRSSGTLPKCNDND